MSDKSVRKQAENVPKWVKELNSNIHALSHKEMKKLEKWFSEASAEQVWHIMSDSNFRATQEVAGRQLSVQTLTDLEQLYPPGKWDFSFFHGILSNPNIREVPFIWENIKRGIPGEHCLQIIEWLDLSECRPFINLIISQGRDLLDDYYCMITLRPEIISILSEVEMRSLLASERKVHRTTALLALGEARKRAAPSKSSPENTLTRRQG